MVAPRSSGAPAATAMLVVVAIAVLVAALTWVRPTAETVVLEWTFGRVLAFARWVIEYIVTTGRELSEELLAWLAEQWEKLTPSSD